MKRSFKKKKFEALALGVLFVGMAFLSVGCPTGGNWIKDLDDQLENGEITQEEYDEQFEEYSGGIGLQGIKVLRRPSTYDYEKNTKRDDEITDYYQGFSKDLFEIFSIVYGVLNYNFEKQGYSDIFDALNNIQENEGTTALKQMYGTSNDDLKYFYDAIRYQITDVRGVDQDSNGTIDYYVVSADTSKAWNWVKGYDEFAYNVSEIETFVYNDVFSKDEEYGTKSGDYIANDLVSFSLNDMSNPNIGYYSTLSRGFYANKYASTFSNANFINTLTYAIYNIVLGLPIADAGWSGGQWIVSGYSDYASHDFTSSAEYALSDVKEKFNKLGSYVGLTEKNKKAIKEYILDTMIGASAQQYGLQDLYYQDVVDAVVEYCAALTTTGTAGGTSTVGNSYIASEIVDYPSTSFFISSNEDDEFEFIQSFEYQSILIMPSAKIENLTNIDLDFMYLARDKNGNLLDDKRISIEITVDIRWFDGEILHTLSALGREQTITVYNNSFDPGEEGSWLPFELDSADTGFKEGSNIQVSLDPFDCPEAIDASKEEIPVGILDPSILSKYIDPYTGLRRITLNGDADARNYYTVEESRTFNASGVLDVEKMKAAGVESYLEIVFNVNKEVGNVDKNYDFYVAFSQFFNDVQDLSWIVA